MYPLVVLSHVQPPFACNPILIIYVMHPRKLRACAEPRRAAVRRGEAPLVSGIIYWNFDISTYRNIRYDITNQPLYPTVEVEVRSKLYVDVEQNIPTINILMQWVPRLKQHPS